MTEKAAGNAGMPAPMPISVPPAGDSKLYDRAAAAVYLSAAISRKPKIEGGNPPH